MQGLQVHCSAWPGHSPATLKTIQDVQTRALCTSGGVFAVLSAAYIPPQERPEVFLKSESPYDRWSGGSGIIDPYGNYINVPVYDQETIVYGDIDLSLVVRQHDYVPLVPLEGNRDTQYTPGLERVKALEEQVKEMERRLSSHPSS
ncbi:hypothetical protein ACFLWB_01020 [Chloroflexota bacterium]